MDDIETVQQVHKERRLNTACDVVAGFKQYEWSCHDYHGLECAINTRATLVDLTGCSACDTTVPWTRCLMRVGLMPTVMVDAKRVGRGYFVRAAKSAHTSAVNHVFGLWPCSNGGPAPTTYIADNIVEALRN